MWPDVTQGHAKGLCGGEQTLQTGPIDSVPGSDDAKFQQIPAQAQGMISTYS